MKTAHTGDSVSTGDRREPFTNCCIPRWEKRLYFGVWTAFVARVVYAVYDVSNEYYQQIESHYFEPGWTFINRSKDTSDEEWSLWDRTMRNGFVWWLCGHALLSQATRCFLFEKRWSLLLIYDLIAVVYTVGWRALAMTFVETALLCAVACVTASSLLVWICAVAFLLTLQFPYSFAILQQVGILSTDEPMLVDFGLAAALLRSTSCALTLCGRRRSAAATASSGNDSFGSSRRSGVDCDIAAADEARCGSRGNTVLNVKSETQSGRLALSDAFNILCYVTYLPLYFVGPLMTFDTFCRQVEKEAFRRPWMPWTSSRVAAVACILARVAVWTIVYELTAHYFYFHLLFSSEQVVSSVSLWTAAGLGFMRAQFFMVKYFVLFGGFGALALLDQMTSAGPPSCISRTNRCSPLWRTFDRGLYGFMTSHIYFLVGGSRRGPLRSLVGSLLCFAFVYTWHGMWSHIFYWTLLNFVGIVAERILKLVSALPNVRRVRVEVISSAWNQRLDAVLAIPLTALSWFAVFLFFAGNDVGYAMFSRLIVDGFPSSTILVVVCLYCSNQICTEIDLWEARRETSKGADIWEPAASLTKRD